MKLEFVGVIYLFCMGVMYWVGYRLYGKKMGLNYLGIIIMSVSMLEDWIEV